MAMKKASWRYIVSLLLAICGLAGGSVHCQCSNFVVGGSRMTTYDVPVNNYYGYSVTEMIYTAAEIDAQPGTIKSIGFEYAYGTRMTKKSSVAIYMANVSQSEFASGTDWVVTGLTQVYNGTLNCQLGWNTFQLNGTGFVWTGGSLLVVIDDNSGNYDGPEYKWYCSETAGARLLRVQSETNNYTFSGSGENSVSSRTGTLSTRRPNTQFCIDEDCSWRTGAFVFSGENFIYETGSGDFVEPTIDTSTSASLHPYAGVVTYASSDESIATVDVNTGEVSFTGVYGTVIITATATYSDYCPVKARYRITVYDGCPVIGEGTTLVSAAPIYGSFKYSYDQMLFTPVEVGTAGRITAVGWNAQSANGQPRALDIYMGETEQSDFATTTDWIESGELRLVYSSTAQTWTAGWNGFEVDFPYSGQKNLVVAVDCGATGSSSVTFVGSATSGNKVIYAYSDSYDMGPSTIASYTGQKSVSAVRPNTKICVEPCAGPVYHTEVAGTVCDSFVWARTGLTYKESGTYIDKRLTDHGCEDVDTLVVTIAATEYDTVDEQSCTSYTWTQTGETYTQDTVVNDTLTTTAGCDSIVTLRLAIQPELITTIDTGVCQNAYPFDWNSRHYEGPGTDTLHLHAADGCDSSVVFAVTTLANPSVVLMAPTEAGQCPLAAGVNYTVTTDVTGGSGPYTYTWSGAYVGDEANATIVSNGGCGSYAVEVIVTDANGCQDTNDISFTAADSEQPTFESPMTDTVADNIGNCRYTVPNLVDRLRPRDNCGIVSQVQTPAVNTVISDDTDVKVVVTDGCGNKDSITVHVEVPMTMSGVMNIPTVGSCPEPIGGEYEIGVGIGGGTSPFTFQWRAVDGSRTVTSTDSLFTMVSDGNCHDWNVTVTVTDAQGCQLQKNGMFEVSDNQPPQASNMPEPLIGTGLVCKFVVPDLTERAWDNCGLESVVQVPAAGDTVTGLITAELQMRDKCGNSSVVPIVLTVPDPITFTMTRTPVTCYGDTDGSIVVTNVSGGTGPYTYTFYGQTNTTGEFLNMPVTGFTPMVVTDANGCTGTNIYAEVDGPERLVAYERPGSHTNIDCYGNSTGSIQIEVSSEYGGTPGYAYVFRGDTNTTGAFTGLAAGADVDTAMVIDAAGCSTTVVIRLTEPALLTVSVDSVHNPLCYGESTGYIGLLVEGGTSPYAYTSNGSACVANYFTHVPQGDYSIVVTDAAGCTASATASLSQPTELTATSVKTDLHCKGDGTGTIDLTVVGGTPFAGGEFDYSWSNGATTQDLSNLQAGVYSVTVTDSNGCSVTVNDTLSEPDGMTLTFSPNDTTICKRPVGNQTIVFSVGVMGGSGSYNYHWSNGGTTSSISLSRPSASAVYAVTVTDMGNGCDMTDSVSLTVNYPTEGFDVRNYCEEQGGQFYWDVSRSWCSVDLTLDTFSTSTVKRNASANGCDSTIVLKLAIHRSSAGVLTETACDSYTWIRDDGSEVVYTVSNNSDVYHTHNVAGCDSTVTLDLTIRYSSDSIYRDTVCDSMRWVTGNDSLYTATTNVPYPTSLFANAAGCDSTVYLALVVNYSSVSVDVHDTCDIYTWPVDMQSYTESTTAPQVVLGGTNAVGCDSTVMLDLTIRYSTSGIDIQEHCDLYTWATDDSTYTISTNEPSVVLEAANTTGCDSTVTLNLVIHYSDTTRDDTVTICENQSYEWRDVEYDTAGTYERVFANQYGCDSVVTFTLITKDTHQVYVYDTCSYKELPWTYNDRSYDYKVEDDIFELKNQYNCDSTVHYYLQPIWKCEEFIQFPTVVTPNGDGINDRFVVINLLEGGCYPHNHLCIFNRWGYLLYERVNIKSDDEFWDPADMPEGTYFYRFDGYGFEDKMERRGSFEIIK